MIRTGSIEIRQQLAWLPGDEDKGEEPTDLSRLPGKVEPVHSRHSQVCYYQVDLLPEPLQDLQGLSCRRCFEQTISFFFQPSGEHLPHSLLVIHQQDSLTPSFGAALRFGRTIRGSLHQRQRDGKGGS